MDLSEKTVKKFPEFPAAQTLFRLLRDAKDTHIQFAVAQDFIDDLRLGDDVQACADSSRRAWGLGNNAQQWE